MKAKEAIVGKMVVHSKHGKGIILSITEDTAEARFGDLLPKGTKIHACNGIEECKLSDLEYVEGESDA